MAEPPDLASLAKRYLDLWQEQLIAMAADPELADSMARLLAGLVPPGYRQWPAGAGLDAGAPGAAAAAAASRERGDRLDDLARRLAAVEGRLAALEAGVQRGGERARAKPRRNRA